MPSAAMSNYATKLVNGNVSLSITLTSLCALLSFITVPLYLNLFGKYIYEDFFELNLITFSIAGWPIMYIGLRYFSSFT